MNPRIKIVGSVILGVLVTIGGWWLFLIAADILPYPRFSIPTTIILLFGFAGFITGMLGYGPMILYESWKEYRKEVS